MTNWKYHRCVAALERFTVSAFGGEGYYERKRVERAALEEKVRRYRNGELRAIHGQTRRHRSTVAA